MLISLFSTLTFVSLSQYPSWMPNEFKNKVFCGEFDCSGKMIGGTTSFNTVPYELIISEEGIQVSINPGAKFRRNEWGKTIKIKYKTKEIWQSKEFSFWKKYELDLSSANETNDSPLHPEYRLNRITISVSNYNNQILTRDQQRSFNAYPIDKSWIEFDVSVPYYGTGGPGKGTWANASICRSIKTQGEILKEKKEKADQILKEKKEKADQENLIKATIEKFIKQKNVVQAQLELYRLDENPLLAEENKGLESRIQVVRKKNIQEILQLLQSNKLDDAIELYHITGTEKTVDDQIKSALIDKFPEPKNLLDNLKIISLLSSNVVSELRNIAFDSKSQLMLTIHKDGQAVLKNDTKILKQFKAEDRFISKNSYKGISFPVDANYNLTLEVDSLNSSVFGLELSKDFLQFKSDIDSKKRAYYFVRNEAEQMVLSTISDEKKVIKKYPDAKRINNFEFSIDYASKKARIIYTCPLLVNGQSFWVVNYIDKNYITKFKKF